MEPLGGELNRYFPVWRNHWPEVGRSPCGLVAELSGLAYHQRMPFLIPGLKNGDGGIGQVCVRGLTP